MRMNLPNRRKVSALLSLLFPLFIVANASAQGVSATWQVQRYDISATLPSGETNRDLVAKARLDLKNISSGNASTLTLRISPNAQVTTVSLNGTSVDFTRSEEKVGSGSLQRILIRMPAVQAGSLVSTVVDYKLSVKENSGLAAISSAGSQFLPLSFWYPTPNSWYFARGADFAPVELQVTASGQTVISGGIEKGSSVEQNLFSQPFFVAGNWEKVTSAGVDVFIGRDAGENERKAATELATLTSEAKGYVAGVLGKGPDGPLRLVSVRRGGGYSSGGVILIDDGAFRRGRIDSVTAMSVIEAVVRLWVADRLRVEGEGFGAIREGLARFIATQFLEQKYGKPIADIERMRQRVSYSLVAQRDAPMLLVAPLDDYYYPVVANKGAMIWRLLHRRVGSEEFYKRIAASLYDGSVSIAEIRTSFADQRTMIDPLFDQLTDINLMVGLPQVSGGETKIALANTGGIDVTVNVVATLANNEKVTGPTTIRAKSYGEIVFKTSQKVTRVEVDPEKLYPQTDYTDDVAPREATESDPQLAVKRAFDKQEFANAENLAKTVLREFPNFDEVRILLARALLGQNKNVEAEREFRTALDEKLPTPRTIAWANLGLGEVSFRNGQREQAMRFAGDAIKADAEYGASYGARVLRNRISATSIVPDDIRTFFTMFDRAAAANRKAELEALTATGEATRFTSGISGQTVEWRTQPTHVDRLDANTILVEAQMTIKLLNREVETGMAVYRLIRTTAGWRLTAVEIFEVR